MIIKILREIKQQVELGNDKKAVALIDTLISDIEAKKYDDLFMTVITSRIGAKGGRSTSEKKIAAARANGLLGGRKKGSAGKKG